MKTFIKKYKLPFLNYAKDSLQLDKKYFYNAMHLNKKGSLILSQKIANDIKELLTSSNFVKKIINEKNN